MVGRKADQQIAVVIVEQRGRLRRKAGKIAGADRLSQVDDRGDGRIAVGVLHDAMMIGGVESEVEVGDQQVAARAFRQNRRGVDVLIQAPPKPSAPGSRDRIESPSC